MNKFSDFITKHSKNILIITIVLLVFSFIGMKMTKINYDILVYLPNNYETIKGQNILTDEFKMGFYSIAVVENANAKELLAVEDKLRDVDGVGEVFSIYDVFGTNIPLEVLPSEVRNKVHKENTDVLFVTFLESTSNEKTIDAVREIRNITSDNYMFGGMSSMVLDTMELSEKEITIYVAIAVVLCLLVLELSLDSYLVPLLLLLNIGVSIIFNLGTNVFLGEISYITKALVAVLQLGVTTDFSIFLYHAYESKKGKMKKEEAMKLAIKETFTSVIGSSTTTIAGFLVLCTMSLTLGKDLGIVMAKGVLLGVITVLTIFPALLLVFDKWCEKTSHKVITPKFDKFNNWIVKRHKVIFAIFILLLVPIYLANNKVNVYYKIDKTLPDTLESIKANNILKDDYNIVSPEIILVDSNMKTGTINNMISEIKKLSGVDLVLSASELSDYGITTNMLEDKTSMFKSDKYQMILVNSLYEVASDELNDEIDDLNKIVKSYDKNAIVAGEGPLMKDLITTSDTDFNNVNGSSIVCIFIILFIVLKSFSLPFLLIIAIEAAICMNMSISYLSGVTLPFVAPIVLGTIQLGATIDYAILMTTTYLNNRKTMDKKEAILSTLNNCGNSVFISGLCFFAATFGVGAYSKLEMVGSLCTLISRGAILSMIIVITVLPSILLIFDKLIGKTMLGKDNFMKNNKKIITSIFLTGALMMPLSANALTKNETVYGKLNPDGSVKSSFVNEELLNTGNGTINDITNLEDIINLSGNESFNQKGDKITWEGLGNNIFYQGKTSKELPVSANITYKLDGKEIELKDLAGKSGKVTIEVKFTNNSRRSVNVNGSRETMYTPFVVMSTFTLDDSAKNINVSSGKVINNGKVNMVAALSTPGLSDSLKLSELSSLNKVTITYGTDKFSLGTVYMMITPKLISSRDISSLSNITSVTDKLNTLNDAINALESGASSLELGTKNASEGSIKLSAYLDKLYRSSVALSNGSISLDDGVKTLSKELSQVSNILGDNSEDITKMQMLLQADKNTINSLKTNNEKIKTAYDTAELKDKEYIDLLNASQNELFTVKYEYENHYNSNLQIIGLLEQNVAAIEKTLATFDGLNKKVNAMLPALNKGLEDLNKGTEDLKTNTAMLAEGVKELASNGKALASGLEEISSGMTELSEGIKKLDNEGIKPVTDKVNNMLVPTAYRAKELVKLGENYTSFAGSNTTGETKFIYVMDGVEAKEEVKTTSTETEKENLWTRIKNIFK